MVAAHSNIRKSGMFGPYSKRVAPATLENIQAAKDGRLPVDMPWVLDDSPSSIYMCSSAYWYSLHST